MPNLFTYGVKIILLFPLVSVNFLNENLTAIEKLGFRKAHLDLRQNAWLRKWKQTLPKAFFLTAHIQSIEHAENNNLLF